MVACAWSMTPHAMEEGETRNEDVRFRPGMLR